MQAEDGGEDIGHGRKGCGSGLKFAENGCAVALQLEDTLEHGVLDLWIEADGRYDTRKIL